MADVMFFTPNQYSALEFKAVFEEKRKYIYVHIQCMFNGKLYNMIWEAPGELPSTGYKFEIQTSNKMKKDYERRVRLGIDIFFKKMKENKTALMMGFAAN